MREESGSAGGPTVRATWRTARKGWCKNRLVLLLSGLAAWTCLAMTPAPAHADFIISATSTTVTSGNAGTFDIVLSLPAAAASSMDLAGFSVQVGVASGMGVTFTAIDFPLSGPYVFGSNSNDSFDKAFGLPLASVPVTATSAAGADLSNNALGFVTINSGDVFELATVSFTTDGTHTGAVPVTFDLAGTSLSDPNGNEIPFTPTDGTINITDGGEPAAAPAPPALVLCLTGAAALSGYRGYRRSRAGADKRGA